MCNHANREAAMTPIDAETWCDPCLEPLIRALNTNGLRTIASCCGHGTHFGWVMLDNDITLTVTSHRDHHALETRKNPTREELLQYAQERASNTYWLPEGYER